MTVLDGCNVGDGNDHAKLVGHIQGWADYAHLQYSSAWCLALGGIAGTQLSQFGTVANPTIIVLSRISNRQWLGLRLAASQCHCGNA